jgi:hypothetical protein
VKRAKKKGGGLCLYLKKKHHWSEAKYKKCVTNSNKKRGRKRHARSANPWAVCHSQGLKKGTAKFERCVMKVKRKR